MATKWLSKDELAAWKGLWLMQLQVEARLAEDLARHELSLPDYLVLATLADQVDGKMRIVELGKELGWEKSRVSHQVTRMVGRGLVDKEPCKTDGRGFFVVLAEQGRLFARKAAPNHVELVRKLVIDQLSENELRTVRKVSERVLENIQKNHES
jgi:DNA-binding MarR family transcriptional regulator